MTLMIIYLVFYKVFEKSANWILIPFVLQNTMTFLLVFYILVKLIVFLIFASTGCMQRLSSP